MRKKDSKQRNVHVPVSGAGREGCGAGNQLEFYLFWKQEGNVRRDLYVEEVPLALVPFAVI